MIVSAPTPANERLPSAAAAGLRASAAQATDGQGHRPARLRAGRAAAVVSAFVVVLAAGVTWARPDGAWRDGSRHGDWVAVFDGYGTTRADEDDGRLTITLEPRPAARPAMTHASLVVTAAHYTDFAMTVRVHTEAQLRAAPQRANPWEVGWVVWHYDTNRHFYYFALKPNGWELGKVDPKFEGGQRFLATGERPAGYAERHRVRVRQIENTIEVWVDGRPVVTYTDEEDPYLRGAVGVYSEDAVVEFSDFAVSSAVAD